VSVKVAVLVACWVAALGGTGAASSRSSSPRRSAPPHADVVARPRASCLPRDKDSLTPSGSDLANGVSLTVDRGQVVYVMLEEPAEIEPAPSSFPWPTPRSSNTAVLVRVPICKYPELVTTEAVTVTAFRAVGAGTATVTAPLSRAWQKWQASPHESPSGAPQQPFESFSANVAVTRN